MAHRSTRPLLDSPGPEPVRGSMLALHPPSERFMLPQTVAPHQGGASCRSKGKRMPRRRTRDHNPSRGGAVPSTRSLRLVRGNPRCVRPFGKKNGPRPCDDVQVICHVGACNVGAVVAPRISIVAAAVLTGAPHDSRCRAVTRSHRPSGNRHATRPTRPSFGAYVFRRIVSCFGREGSHLNSTVRARNVASRTLFLQTLEANRLSN